MIGICLNQSAQTHPEMLISLSLYTFRTMTGMAKADEREFADRATSALFSRPYNMDICDFKWFLVETSGAGSSIRSWRQHQAEICDSVCQKEMKISLRRERELMGPKCAGLTLQQDPKANPEQIKADMGHRTRSCWKQRCRSHHPGWRNENAQTWPNWVKLACMKALRNLRSLGRCQPSPCQPFKLCMAWDKPIGMGNINRKRSKELGHEN